MENELEKKTAPVKIMVAIPGRKDVSLQLSENKFSFILSTIVVTSFWGFLSTGLLLYVLWNGLYQSTTPSQEVQIVGKVIERAASSAPQEENTQVKPTFKKGQREYSKDIDQASAIDPLPEKSEINFGNELKISDVTLKKQKRILNINFLLTNTDSWEKKGYIWALAHFKKANGSTFSAYSSYMAEINTNGLAINPDRGSPFSIRTHKLQELNIPELLLQNAELTKITFGAYLHKDKKQITAELKVIDSPRSQAPSTMVFPKSTPKAH